MDKMNSATSTLEKDKMVIIVSDLMAAKQAHDIDALIALYHPDCTFEQPSLGVSSRGHEAIRPGLEAFAKHFPDYERKFEGEGVFDKTSENFDPIVYGKRGWLNVPWWVIRSVFYLLVWNAYRMLIRRNSIKEDTINDGYKLYKKNYNMSVVFLFLFMITESMSVWDWIMGLDPHWFSTLFGWYVLATLLVSAITVIAFVTIYLRSKGYLPKVNDSHIHDLAKFMFGFSVFWTYLWFAQFMLIWYADIPEETTYFVLRFTEYKTLFLSMLVMNFVFPILLLINSDFKSRPWFVVIGGIVILAGHYIDLFIMIMPGTVGGSWSFGIPEIGATFFFLGIFIYTVFSAFAKADPIPKGNPFLHESEHFHYFNIEHHSEEDNQH